MDNKTNTVGALIVDYDFYCSSPKVRAFVERRKHRASMVLLVSTPDARDPEDTPQSVDWDIVIRNHKGHTDQSFKTAALTLLATSSNVYPAVTIDWFNQETYEEVGTLMVLDGEYFQ